MNNSTLFSLMLCCALFSKKLHFYNSKGVFLLAFLRESNKISPMHNEEKTSAPALLITLLCKGYDSTAIICHRGSFKF
jgi:hypothetical protein